MWEKRWEAATVRRLESQSATTTDLRLERLSVLPLVAASAQTSEHPRVLQWVHLLATW